MLTESLQCLVVPSLANWPCLWCDVWPAWTLCETPSMGLFACPEWVCTVEAMLCPAGQRDTLSQRYASPLWRSAAEIQRLHPWERYKYVSDSQLYSGQHLPY